MNFFKISHIVFDSVKNIPKNIFNIIPIKIPFYTIPGTLDYPKNGITKILNNTPIVILKTNINIY